MPTRSAVVQALTAQVQAELDAVERMAALARDEATSEESKSEGKYDTRATEASYLARGQAERVGALRKLAAWFATLGDMAPSRVGLGALVALEDEPAWLFIAPAGGTGCTVEGQPVRLTSLSSPVGRAMVGLEAGDGFEVETPRQIREHFIEALH